MQTSRPCARAYLIVQSARNLYLLQDRRNVDQFAPKFRKNEKGTASGQTLVRINSVMSLPAYLLCLFLLMMT